MDLYLIILDIVDFVHNSGITLKSMVCDQGSPNVAALKILNITVDNPYLMYSGHKIFFNFDVPHLIIYLRNNFFKYDFEVDNEIVSFNAIRELYEREENYPSKSVPKLTDMHINPDNFEKMRVSPATQISSNTVSAALIVYKTGNQMKNENAVQTTNFVEIIIDLFNCLNSRSTNDKNPMHKPLSDYNMQVIDYLKNCLKFIKTWKIIPIDNKKVKNLPCFDGFYLTVTSVLLQ